VVEAPAPTISYRTGWITYEESLLAGHFVGCGWNGAGCINFYDGRIDPTEYPMPETFRLEMDGQSLVTDWLWRGLEKSADGNQLHIVITLEHGARPVVVRVHATRWLEAADHGNQPAALASTSSWSGVLCRNDRWRSELNGKSLPLYSLGYFDGAKWGEESNFHESKLDSLGVLLKAVLAQR
jgi:hypothetical protein